MFAINRFPIMAAFAKACAELEGFSEPEAEALGAAVATAYAIRKNGAYSGGGLKGLSAADRGGRPGHAWYEKETDGEYVNACGLAFSFDAERCLVTDWVPSRSWRPVSRRDFDKQRDKLDRLALRGCDRLVETFKRYLSERCPWLREGRPMSEGAFFREWKEVRDRARTEEFWAGRLSLN